MEYEIELKLLAPKNAGELIEQKLLPHLHYPVTKQVVELSNYYFDTADRTLRKNDIGLRIRGKGKQLEQTLKTAGSSVGGLHQRPEYNVQLEDQAEQTNVVPNLALFPLSAWPADFPVTEVQQNLTTLFTTHFERKIYLLDVNDTCQIEMVWDTGMVSANGQSVPICEIELELKKGGPRDIFNLARQLLQIMYLSIGTDSKAARGYRLADNLMPIEPELNILLEPIGSKQEFVQVVENGLACLQYFSAQLSVQYSATNTVGIAQALRSLTTAFHQFSQVQQDIKASELHQKLAELEQDWLLLLTKFKNFDENIQDEGAIDKLLFQPRVTQLQLDIVQLLFEINGSVNN